MGLNLQMLLYLFSIWKDRTGSFKRAVGVSGNIYPAGVLYFKAVVPAVNSAPGSDAETVYRAASDKLTRNGLLINDEEILRLMEKKLENKYIPIKLNKDGSISKSSMSSLHTLEEMGALMNSVTETVSKLAYEIKTGKADCNPIKDTKHDGCKYCPHRVICRNPNSFKTKKF
jgi:ATP-dependent helicase/nuclease subunit B